MFSFVPLFGSHQMQKSDHISVHIRAIARKNSIGGVTALQVNWPQNLYNDMLFSFLFISKKFVSAYRRSVLVDGSLWATVLILIGPEYLDLIAMDYDMKNTHTHTRAHGINVMWELPTHFIPVSRVKKFITAALESIISTPKLVIIVYNTRISMRSS